jgi:drug/metabolite transporter (DMT)-like permease
MRSVDTAGAWEQVFWRALGGALAMSALLVWRGGVHSLDEVRRAGWWGVASASCIAGTFAIHVLAINATSVANVLFLQTASPLLMPLLAWVFLREAPHRLTLLAVALAVVGLLPIVLASVGGGRLTGDLLALLTASLGAANILIVRHVRGVDLMPMAAIAGAAACIGAAWVGAPGHVSPADAVALLLLGVVQIAFGLTLFLYALRHLPAAPVALLTLLEPALGPLLVWVIVDEVPHGATLIGGAIILCALLISARAATLSHPRPGDVPA